MQWESSGKSDSNLSATELEKSKPIPMEWKIKFPINFHLVGNIPIRIPQMTNLLSS